MSLPLLQSYNDAKKQKAYLRYMEGKSQREVAAKLKIPARTVAHWSKADGWEEERKARKIAGESPNVAAVAAETTPPLQDAATTPPAEASTETRPQRMERMLARQQMMAGRLVGALAIDIEQTFAAAEAAGKNPTRAQIAQLTSLSNNLLALERKAWGVPDKIETKDTTPHKPDPVRELTDEQLERELEATRRARAAAAAGEAASGSVN